MSTVRQILESQGMPAVESMDVVNCETTGCGCGLIWLRGFDADGEVSVLLPICEHAAGPLIAELLAAREKQLAIVGARAAATHRGGTA